MSDVRELEGSLHIGTVVPQYPDKNYVTVQLDDTVSGTPLIDIKLTLEEASEAFLFNGYVPVKYTIRNPDRAGKRREIKTVTVSGLKAFSPDNDFRESLAKGVEKYLVDGWMLLAPDRRWNHHKSAGGDYRVMLTRYVGAEDDN